MNATRRLGGIAVALLLAALTACTGNGTDTPGPTPTPQTSTMVSINPQSRNVIADGGELRLPVDGFGDQFNPMQVDGAGPGTQLIMSALLPRLFNYDASGNPVPNSDYLSAVDASGENPQVVTYTLNPDAVWGSGQQLSAEDFIATWEACNGQNVSFDCADTKRLGEVASVEEGTDPQQVVVTYNGSYSEWPATFSYLLPKEGVDDPETFNEGWTDLTEISDWLAGPFTVADVDHRAGVLAANPNDDWWADPAKLSQLTFIDVAEKDQLRALQDNRIDVADHLGRKGRAKAKKVTGCELRTTLQGNREQVVAVRQNLANYGAFGDSSVVWADVGYLPPTA